MAGHPSHLQGLRRYLVCNSLSPTKPNLHSFHPQGRDASRFGPSECRKTKRYLSLSQGQGQHSVRDSLGLAKQRRHSSHSQRQSHLRRKNAGLICQCQIAFIFIRQRLDPLHTQPVISPLCGNIISLIEIQFFLC